MEHDFLTAENLEQLEITLTAITGSIGTDALSDAQVQSVLVTCRCTVIGLLGSFI